MKCPHCNIGIREVWQKDTDFVKLVETDSVYLHNVNNTLKFT